MRLVLFDCDGTLVDGQHAIVEAMAAAFVHAGLPAPSAAAVRDVLGLSLNEAVERLLPPATPAGEAAAAMLQCRGTFDAMCRGPAPEEPLFPGIREAVDAIAATGALLGIVTGKGRRDLLATLDRQGLRDRFITLHSADDGPGKPAPDMVLDAICRTGADAGSTIVIGDTTFDIEMARNAGVRSVGVAWGNHSPVALKRAGADRIAATPADLPRLVGEMLA